MTSRASKRASEGPESMKPEECPKSGLRDFKMALRAAERLAEVSKSIPSHDVRATKSSTC